MSELTVSEQNILQRKLAKYITSEVFNIIDEEDLLRIGTGEKGEAVWYYKGKALTPQMVKNLKTQAVSFYSSDLWKILRDELLWNAQNKTLSKGETESDLIQGKLMRYLVEVIDKRLSKMV